MIKGWRLNVALVERRERLKRERFERQVQNMKFECEMRASQASLDRMLDRFMKVKP